MIHCCYSILKWFACYWKVFSNLTLLWIENQMNEEIYRPRFFFLNHQEIQFHNHWILQMIIIEYQSTYYIKEKQSKQTYHCGKWSNLVVQTIWYCFSSLAYRGKTPKRAFLVESNENIKVLFFTISWKIHSNQQFKIYLISIKWYY